MNKQLTDKEVNDFLRERNLKNNSMTCVYMDKFTNTVGRHYEGQEKWRITFKYPLEVQQRLDLINILYDKFKIEIDTRNEFCTFLPSKEQLDFVIKFLDMKSVVYQHETLDNYLRKFLNDNKLTRKLSIHKMRTIREWIANYLNIKWYDIQFVEHGFEFEWYGNKERIEL